MFCEGGHEYHSDGPEGEIGCAVSHLADFQPGSVTPRRLEQGRPGCGKHFSATAREALGIFLGSTSNLGKFRKSWSSVAFCRFGVEANTYSTS